MKIRLMGTEDECQWVAGRLRAALRVLEESGPYANRPPSQLVRMYIEVDVPVPVEPPAPASRGR